MEDDGSAPDETTQRRPPSITDTDISKRRLLMRQLVFETVAQKRRWSGPHEPAEAALLTDTGAKGWNTRGYLPHYDHPGTLQMVTFRLADAMPAGLRHEWYALLAISDERERRTRLEAYLDRGRGDCLLRSPAAAVGVEEVLLRFNGERYHMLAWIIMPNHVHVLFELWTLLLGRLLKAWKGTSARLINQVLRREGTVWQEDYWDRYLRDEAHFRKACHYIEWNPVKARLAPDPAAWSFSSANPRWRWTSPNRYHGGRLINPRGEPER
jgi:REP element-mobilizing transposase RayT